MAAEPFALELSAEMERALRSHVMETWFPRCIDTHDGGFFSEFDRKWRKRPSEARILEFEARQTRAAARIALAYPAEPQWKEYALHGFRFLRDVMWDPDNGGWYWSCTRGGAPLAAATKHMHSTSYAVQACFLVSRATGDESALALARAGLEWSLEHAWDARSGGFHSWLTREGEPILDDARIPAGAGTRDPIGDRPGLKNLNVHGDWFEALLDGWWAQRDQRVHDTLAANAGLYLEHFTTPEGEVRYGFTADWKPVSGPEHFGYSFQGAHRFLSAAPLFPDLPLAERARKLTIRGLREGARRGGGVALESSSGQVRPLRQFGSGRRSWWVQLEALRPLAHFAAAPGRNQEAFQRRLLRHWRFVATQVFDSGYGGSFGTVPGDLMPWYRPTSPVSGRFLEKGHLWKDASHDTDSLLAAIGALRGHSTAFAS